MAVLLACFSLPRAAPSGTQGLGSSALVRQVYNQGIQIASCSGPQIPQEDLSHVKSRPQEDTALRGLPLLTSMQSRVACLEAQGFDSQVGVLSTKIGCLPPPTHSGNERGSSSPPLGIMCPHSGPRSQNKHS